MPVCKHQDISSDNTAESAVMLKLFSIAQRVVAFTFANNTGASALIILTSSSDFMICRHMTHELVSCFRQTSCPTKQTSYLYLLDSGQRELMILELCRVCANLLNFKVLLLPKHSKLDALLLQLLSHGLREACRIVLGNLHAVKMRTYVEHNEGLSNAQQLELIRVQGVSQYIMWTRKHCYSLTTVGTGLQKPVQVTCNPPGT